MQDHKQDVINTRKGCLGGSDAKMLKTIAETGTVPQSAMKRLAVCKGLIEHEQFTNRAMEFGNYIEECVFNGLHETDSRWQSNPCIVSEKYSRKNVKCIDHVDFMLQDDEKKTLTLGECKATRLSYLQTRNEYDAQLQHHCALGKEIASRLGGYKVKVLLCHYSTEGLDLDDTFEFDPSRLTVKPVRFAEASYDLKTAMNIVDEFLETYEYYSEDDSIPYEYLPVDVQKQFDDVTVMLSEIKTREDAVNAFKARLYDFLVEKGIKSIKNDSWSIIRVDPTTSVQFDAKRYLEDYAAKHPKKYKTLRKDYDKTVAKKGFVSIKVKKQ